MPRLLVALATATLGGCTCSAPSPSATLSTPSAATPGPAPSARSSSALAPSSSGSAWLPPPGTDVFSAPIAAIKITGDHLLVAGLVVSAQAIRLAALSTSGATEWTSDVLTQVHWKSGARLRVFPAADGAAVVFAGEKDGAPGTFVAVVGPRGEPRGAPFAIAGDPCSTKEGLVWTESAKNAPVKVRMRRYADGGATELATLKVQAAPQLTCGDHAVYGFVDDDEENKYLHILLAPDGKPQKPLLVVDSKDFPDEDEERSFNGYLDGDELGMVRGGPSGELLVRDLEGTTLTPWRKLTHTLETDESVEVVDANRSTLIIIYSKDAPDDCAQGGRRVFALTVDRKSRHPHTHPLSSGLCGKEVSDVWLSELRDRPFQAVWLEPGSRSEGDGAPIAGLSFAATSDDGTAVRMKVPADAIVDAGCDSSGCYAVALARTPGTDGMSPEALRVLKYP